MVIDSSALLAILLGEPEQEPFTDAITADRTRLLSAVSLLEAAIVLASRKGSEGVRDLDAFVRDASIEVVAFTAQHADLARDAWERLAGAGIRLRSISATAASTRWHARPANPCCTKGTTSVELTSP